MNRYAEESGGGGLRASFAVCLYRKHSEKKKEKKRRKTKINIKMQNKQKKWVVTEICAPRRIFVKLSQRKFKAPADAGPGLQYTCLFI